MWPSGDLRIALVVPCYEVGVPRTRTGLIHPPLELSWTRQGESLAVPCRLRESVLVAGAAFQSEMLVGPCVEMAGVQRATGWGFAGGGRTGASRERGVGRDEEEPNSTVEAHDPRFCGWYVVRDTQMHAPSRL